MDQNLNRRPGYFAACLHRRWPQNHGLLCRLRPVVVRPIRKTASAMCWYPPTTNRTRSFTIPRRIRKSSTATIPPVNHLDTQNAEVMLADIAFVRLRHGLDNALLQGKSSFSQSVAKAQQALGPAHLSIDLKQRCIKAQDTLIKLIPTDLAFYSWLLKRQLAEQPLPTCPNDGAPEHDYAEQYLQEYRLINGELGGADRTIQALQHGMSKPFFEQRKSRINKTLQQTLSHAASAYLISAVGQTPQHPLSDICWMPIRFSINRRIKDDHQAIARTVQSHRVSGFFA